MPQTDRRRKADNPMPHAEGYVSTLARYLVPAWLLACSAQSSEPQDRGASAGRGGSGGAAGSGGSSVTGGQAGSGAAAPGPAHSAAGAAMAGNRGNHDGGATEQRDDASIGGGSDASVVPSPEAATLRDAATDTAAGRGDGGTARGDAASDARPTTPDAGTTGAARTITNLFYAGTNAMSQALDLALPANARLPLPLVIRIHGGGFSGGSKEMESVGTAARAILAKGYALASVNYRLSGEALFPAGGQDVKASVRWLRAHAADYGLDPERFATWGESAGGYMAVLVGVTGDQPTVFDDPALGNPTVSSAVQAVIDWYGPVNLATMDAHAMARPPASCPTSYLMHTPAGSPEGRWLGGALSTAAVATKLAQANLTAYIATAKTLPAFFIAHGDDDCQVPWGQSQELADALAEAGNTATLNILAGAAHSDGRFESTQSVPAVTFLAERFGR